MTEKRTQGQKACFEWISWKKNFFYHIPYSSLTLSLGGEPKWKHSNQYYYGIPVLNKDQVWRNNPLIPAYKPANSTSVPNQLMLVMQTHRCTSKLFQGCNEVRWGEGCFLIHSKPRSCKSTKRIWTGTFLSLWALLWGLLMQPGSEAHFLGSPDLWGAQRW